MIGFEMPKIQKIHGLAMIIEIDGHVRTSSLLTAIGTWHQHKGYYQPTGQLWDHSGPELQDFAQGWFLL